MVDRRVPGTGPSLAVSSWKRASLEEVAAPEDRDQERSSFATFLRAQREPNPASDEKTPESLRGMSDLGLSDLELRIVEHLRPGVLEDIEGLSEDVGASLPGLTDSIRALTRKGVIYTEDDGVGLTDLGGEFLREQR